MILARFLAIASFMRFLPKMGYGLNWREVIVLTYGGLRGAIGIAFAMIVAKDDEFDQKTRDIVILLLSCLFERSCFRCQDKHFLH